MIRQKYLGADRVKGGKTRKSIWGREKKGFYTNTIEGLWIEDTRVYEEIVTNEVGHV